MSAQKLSFGLPSGSLQDATIDLMRRAGYRIKVDHRSYYPTIDDDDIECILLRAQEIPRYVANGVIDAGITGYDWVLENEADVHEQCELVFSKATRNPVRWVLCVPESSSVQSVKDLEGARIATEAVQLTSSYLAKNGVSAKVEFSWGATEVKPPILADAIVEVTETGSTIKANGLRIVDEVLVSTPRLIVNHESNANQWKREKVESIALMVHACLSAEGQVVLIMNVRKENLETVLSILPALQKPTIAPLSDPDWVDCMTVLDETLVRSIIPALKNAGATGIVEYPASKIIN